MFWKAWKAWCAYLSMQTWISGKNVPLKKNIMLQKMLKKNIKRIDRERRDYFRYYTGKEWESPDNYDLMINTAAIGIDGAVETIKNYLKTRGFQI